MEESKALFRTIITYPWFTQVTIKPFSSNSNLTCNPYFAVVGDIVPEQEGPAGREDFVLSLSR